MSATVAGPAGFLRDADRGRLLDEVLDVLADPSVPDDQAGRLVRARIGMPRLQAARRAVRDREPRDHGHLDLLAARYKHRRSFTPAVIAEPPPDRHHNEPTGRGVAERRLGVEGAEPHRTYQRPDHATTAEATTFVPARWRSYLDDARAQDRGTLYWHYWELAVLCGAQVGLRSGDVWVPGSRRYTDPATLLVPAAAWAAGARVLTQAVDRRAITNW